MAVILVTGSQGQLGNEIRTVSEKFYGYDFIFTDINELDITDDKAVSNFIKDKDPDWIINCAAYNMVDKAEEEPERAFMINGTAVRNITKAIEDSNIRFIHISTDYVYEGTSNVPYDESSPTVPVSSYGRSKLAGENFALQYYNSIIIRTSWLYSSFGNNFVKTIIRHAGEKDSLKVVFDQAGTPTYANDLASAVISVVSGVIRNRFTFIPGIYNYSDEGVSTWYDFAVDIVNLTGLKCNIIPVLTKDYLLPAPRPSYSVMDKSKIKETYNISIPHWRESLKSCLKILK